MDTQLRELTKEEGDALSKDLIEVLKKHDAELGIKSAIELLKRVPKEEGIKSPFITNGDNPTTEETSKAD